ncbi:hypothetical protein [Flavobacterium sp.]|uniref:hypothetical protein n=1 Tax=Flavobacterium sp. TaxID=239 RepID=UPI0040334F0E
MKKIRAILKTRDGFVSVYWLNKQGNHLIGWFSGNLYRKVLKIPDGNNFDSHFTYPPDGNCHFSYKSTNKEFEEYVNVYWDKVKIKQIKNGTRKTFFKPRDEYNFNILEHLAPGYLYKPLNEVVIQAFPTSGFRIVNGSFEKVREMSPFLPENSILETDLVIDVSELDGYTFNVFGCVKEINQKTPASIGDYIYSKDVPISETHTIEIICILIKG